MRRRVPSLGLLLLIASVPAWAQLRAETVVSGLIPLIAAVAGIRSVPASSTRSSRTASSGSFEDSQVLPAPFLDVRAAIVSGGERGLLGFAFAPDYATSGRRVRELHEHRRPHGGGAVQAIGGRSPRRRLRVALRSALGRTASRFIAQPFRITTAGTSRSAPTATCTSGWATADAAMTRSIARRTPTRSSARCCGSTSPCPDDDRKATSCRPTIRFVGAPASCRRSGRSASAIRGALLRRSRLGGTGALVIGDVGQNAREEINYEPAGRGGRNYGWRIREGSGISRTPNVPRRRPRSCRSIDPMLDYRRPTGATVTGGFVYRGRALGAEYFGRYFFADSESGRLWSVA